MLRGGMALAAALLLGGIAEIQAQVPRGNGQIKFVPVDTTKNLATAIPSVNIPQSQPSFFDRFYQRLKLIVPFAQRTPTNMLSAPKMPVTKLPQPQAPTTKGLPSLPQLPPLVSGAAR